MIGMGYYGTLTPGVILRNVLENPGWYTAYTPYQAEVSQGRLEALLTFQQMIADLTGLELANASLLDEATAAAEAMAMAKRVSRSSALTFFVDADCHPQTLAVLRTRAEGFGWQIAVGDPFEDLDEAEVFGALLHYPGSSGAVRDLRPVIEKLHAGSALAIVATDLLSLVLLTPPGELGADVAIGSAQRFGVPMGYGGPHAAFFATKDQYKRAMPGRLIGVSVDSQGRPALRMALQTREQHIRREKATSNICTAQVLLAVMAAMYAVYHGPHGLTRIASRVHRLAAILAEGLRRSGVEVVTEAFFDTLTVRVPGQARAIAARAEAAGINLRLVDADHLGIALDETTGRADLQTLWSVFGGDAALEIDQLERAIEPCLPEPLRRQSAFLSHPVFQRYHSETQMLRYLRRLQDKDLALDRSMIPLGLLHDEAERDRRDDPGDLAGVRWPASVRAERPGGGLPAAVRRARGDAARDHRLRCDLAPAQRRQPGRVRRPARDPALPPGKGSRRARRLPDPRIGPRHQSRERHHGRPRGRGRRLRRSGQRRPRRPRGQGGAVQGAPRRADDHLSLDPRGVRGGDPRHRSDRSRRRRPGLSRRGQPERAGRHLPAGRDRRRRRPSQPAQDLLHPAWRRRPGHGPDRGQGASGPLPARPCGGAGVNPAAAGDGTAAQVSAAPWGSPSILPISWAYIAMMGGAGLTRATEVAILNANYIARRLAPHYPILYSGKHGLVAHECIIDLRPLKQATGITVEDVAKRLIDYGFHAPTMSFPVPETLMIEPTESEAKRELDRFCDAMIGIREEILAIEQGAADATDNLLKNAPHTADRLLGDWPHPYARQAAFFPGQGQLEAKYWPPVGRVDNVYGDRHLVCACPPIEAYQAAAE